MARGAVWLVLFRLADRGIGFVSTLILARLLVPADFGVVAMGMSVLAALEMLSAFNFDIALVQNPKAERRHFDTAWTFSILFAVFTSLAMCVLAVPAAAFYNEPQVAPLMVALAATALIRGFDNIGVVAFQKELQLDKEVKLGLVKRLAGFVVTIAAAVVFRNYWALVCGTLTQRVVGVVMSYRMHPYRPRWSLAASSELLRFSSWLLLNNFLIFLNNRGPDFMIGRFGGAKSLGTYALSFELANLPTTELVFPISRAVLPGYALMADRPQQLREAFVNVLSLIAMVSIPAGALIGLIAEPTVRLLLGSRWIDAVPLIEVLAMFGIVRSLHGPNGSVYLVLGKPYVIAALQCVQLVVALVLMGWWVPAHGALGAAWALVVGAGLAMASNFTVLLRMISLPIVDVLAALWRPSIATVAMAFALWPARAALSAKLDGDWVWKPAVEFASLATLGVVTYAATLLLLWAGRGRPPGAELIALEWIGSKWRSQRSNS
jgi:lipopolysaccharide exporter